MKNFSVGNLALWACGLGLVAVGCASNSNGNGLASLASVGGTSVNGGTFGVVSGGAFAAGGLVSNGGTATNGGMPGTISTNTGGATAIGGNAVGGASNGGNSAAGGAPATGGGVAQGGNSGNGGTSGVGGSATTGGATNTAGAKAAGGASATGGKAGTAGATATGGAKATGGAPATGGATATGGAAGAAGAPYRGVANSPCLARTNLKVSWYYNWMQTANEPCNPTSLGGEFVPMIWGHAGAEVTSAGITSAITAMVGRGNKAILGFNEPDNTTQSNIPVATAISLWPAFNNPSIRIGSPGPQANTTGVAWITSFNTQVNANASLRVDFIAFHWYGWNAGSCDANAATLEAHIRTIEALPGNRPLWLTEWGCLNGSDNASATVTQAHIAGAVAMFARHPRIERYAWYPWAGASHSLNNADGSLTALGTFYASLPAYK